MHYAMENDYDIFSSRRRLQPSNRLPARMVAGMQDGRRDDGSRYIPGGRHAGLAAVARVHEPQHNGSCERSRMPVKDASVGFAVTASRRYGPPNSGASVRRGYSFQQEVLFRCFRRGPASANCPIVFGNRRRERRR